MTQEPLFKGLSTMLPVDVHKELSDIAKEYATYSGNWDYGVVIRELLWMRRVFINVNTRIDELEQELKLIQQEGTPTVEDKKKEEEVKPGYDNSEGFLGKTK